MHRLLAVYIKQHFHAGPLPAKDIQRVIDTINDGTLSRTLYLRGPVRIGIRILCD